MSSNLFYTDNMKLPIPVTDEVLEINPKFTQLLKALSFKISQDGTSMHLKSEIEKVSSIKCLNLRDH